MARGKLTMEIKTVLPEWVFKRAQSDAVLADVRVSQILRGYLTQALDDGSLTGSKILTKGSQDSGSPASRVSLLVDDDAHHLLLWMAADMETSLKRLACGLIVAGAESQAPAVLDMTISQIRERAKIESARKTSKKDEAA